MSELRALFLLELKSLWGINKAIHTHDKKAKHRYAGLGIVWALLIVMIMVYVGALVWGLCSLGLHSIVPAYLTVIASALVLAFGLFGAGHRIFGQKGYDMLSSLPIRPVCIVFSRFFGLYIGDLAFCLLVMVPGMGVYGFMQHPPITFYLGALVGTLLMPALPLVISTLFGTVVMAISSRMKNKSLMQSVLMVLVVVGIMLSSFSMGNATESMTEEMLAQLATDLGSVFGSVYPPAQWLNDGLIAGKAGSFLLYVLLSLGVMAIGVYLVARNFHTIVHRLNSFGSGQAYQLGAMEKKSLLKALYLREGKRYFASSIYVTNTIIGPIMGTLMAAAVCVIGMEEIRKAIPLPVDLALLMPYAFAAMFCMMPPSSVSISMEGKGIWQIKSLPIPMKTLVDSKILWNLSLNLPFYLISVVLFAIGMQPSAGQLLFLILFPAAMTMFSLVLGMYINVRIHSFDWEREEAVVKQSLPAALGGFAPMFINIALGFAAVAVPQQLRTPAQYALCLLLMGGAYMLYRQACKANMTQM